MFDLRAQIEDFLKYLRVERNCSPLTIRDYHHYLNRFLRWSHDNYAIEKSSDLNIEAIQKYQDYIFHVNSLGLKQSTINYHLIALRSFLRYLISMKFSVVPLENIKLTKTEARSLKFLDGRQLSLLFKSPETSNQHGLRDKAILEVLFSTGLRVSDLVRLNRDQLKLDRNELVIIGTSGKTRFVFLSDRATEWLKRYIDSRRDILKPLFIRIQGSLDNTVGGEKMRLTPRSIQRILDKYVNKAKISIKATPQVLRNSFAIDLLMNGADLRSVQELLGHKNIATTQIYTHVTNQQLREVHKAFHSGNK